MARGPSKKPTKRAACVALREQGWKQAAIAALIGIGDRAVAAHLWAARKRGETTIKGRARGTT